MIDTSSKPKKSSIIGKRKSYQMPAIAFNAGIEKLNKFEEKYRMIKEKAHYCIKGIEHEKPDNMKKLLTMVAEIRKVPRITFYNFIGNKVLQQGEWHPFDSSKTFGCVGSSSLLVLGPPHGFGKGEEAQQNAQCFLRGTSYDINTLKFSEISLSYLKDKISARITGLTRQPHKAAKKEKSMSKPYIFTSVVIDHMSDETRSDGDIDV